METNKNTKDQIIALEALELGKLLKKLIENPSLIVPKIRQHLDIIEKVDGIEYITEEPFTASSGDSVHQPSAQGIVSASLEGLEDAFDYITNTLDPSNDGATGFAALGIDMLNKSLDWAGVF